jgi:flagellar biosynthetic protein FliO
MDYVRQMAAVGGVFLLLGGLLWWMRRSGLAVPGKARRARRMEVLERLSLGPHHSLHLVRMDGAALLVACSPSGCNLIEAASAGRVSEAQL